MLGDALEALRIVAVLACPAVPTTCRRCGGASASPDRLDQRCPRPRLGRLPRGPAGGEGPSAVPPPGSRCTGGPVSRWTDDHCHLGSDVHEAARRRGRRHVAEARAAGVERLVTVGTDAVRSAEAVAPQRGIRRGVGHRRRAPPRGPPRARRARRLLDAPARAPAERRSWSRGRVRARLPLRPLAPAGAAGRVRRPDRAGPRARPGPGDPHARPGTTRSTSSTPRACRRARCSTASPAGPTRRGRASTGAATCRSRASSRSGRPTTSAPRRPCARSTGCSSRPTAPSWHPCPTAAGQPPALVPLVGAAVADAMGVAVDEVAAATWANAESLYRLR